MARWLVQVLLRQRRLIEVARRERGYVWRTRTRLAKGASILLLPHSSRSSRRALQMRRKHFIMNQMRRTRYRAVPHRDREVRNRYEGC